MEIIEFCKKKHSNAKFFIFPGKDLEFKLENIKTKFDTKPENVSAFKSTFGNSYGSYGLYHEVVKCIMNHFHKDDGEFYDPEDFNVSLKYFTIKNNKIVFDEKQNEDEDEDDIEKCDEDEECDENEDEDEDEECNEDECDEDEDDEECDDIEKCDNENINKDKNKLFVPILILNSDNNIARVENCGVFKTEKTALHSLIDTILSEGLILYEQYCDGIEDDSKPLSKKKFVTMIKSKVETGKDLMSLCIDYDDSYFNQPKGWSFKVTNSIDSIKYLKKDEEEEEECDNEGEEEEDDEE